MADRISTLDEGYTVGMLSTYPEAIDNTDTLYEAKNNAETTLIATMTYNTKQLIVNSTSAFPDKGLIRVGLELIYYNEKTTNMFRDLVRGFAGSKQDQHLIGTKVSHSVMAEPHNAVKDAIINIEDNVGLENNPDPDSLNGILQAQEKQFLTPKAKFRSFPLSGPPPLEVRFQNMTNSHSIRFLWDFGDGSTSTEKSPIHTFVGEGFYTVRLGIFTTTGGEGIAIKKNYIEVDEKLRLGFMYVIPEMGTTSTEFEFIDQTDGDIIARHWVFGDGETASFRDPDIHTIKHTYETEGTYDPTLLVEFSDTSVRRVNLGESIIIS